MRSGGPSPIIPTIMVTVLGMVVFGPTILNVSEYVVPLFIGWEEYKGTFSPVMVLLVLSLLVLVQLLSIFSPTLRLPFCNGNYAVAPASSDDSFSFGSLLLVLLFFVIYIFL